MRRIVLSDSQNKLAITFLLVVLLAMAWLAYLPGLSGTFLFDDYVNLSAFGNYGPIRHFWQVVAWITSGISGPTGRPVALASFLLDARNWPAAPEAFKQTNVWIHLINGLLLAGLLRSIALGLGIGRARAGWAGVLAAGIWLLHPFWVSTTLYVIQRMAMLAALFVFAGLWAYVHGRLQLRSGRRRSGYVWMSLGVALGTLLAVFSKENGALLPMLAWLLEAFIFDRDKRALDRDGPGFVWWRRVFVILPSLVVLGYLVSQLPMLFSGNTYGRDFTPIERLLTEARVLWGYLGALWLPGTHAGGLFHDDVRISSSLFAPLSTLFAVLGIVALIVFASSMRVFARSHFWRSAGLAVAFFLVGHVLESTWLPLELVFEHRNYLPAGLMFLPLSIGLVGVFHRHGAIAAWLAMALILSLTMLTTKRADLWGRPFQQALVWGKEHPDSARAQFYLANFWERVGNDPEAIRLLDNAFSKNPNDLLVVVERVRIGCSMGEVPTDIELALRRLAATGHLSEGVTGHQFDALLTNLDQGCGHLGRSFELELIDVAMTNPHVRQSPTEQRSLLHRRALLWLSQSEPGRAYADYLAALRLPGLSPGTRLRFSAELASARHPQLALNLLNAVPSPLQSIHGWTMPAWHQRWLRHVGFYQDSERHLRRELAMDLAKRKTQ